MKMVKNIAIVAFAASFMFAGVGFHYANNYTSMDTGTNVETSYGVTYDLNDNTSVGWDSSLGMMMYFDAPAGVTLRLGWTGAVAGFDAADDGDAGTLTDDDGNPANDDNGFVAETSVGLGFTWWTGGDGLNTSISTAYDMVTTEAATNTTDGNLSVTVGFGF